ncbi:hypothetical protein BD311DRAFT_766049, partial [Dichomitus squalens]
MRIKALAHGTICSEPPSRCCLGRPALSLHLLVVFIVCHYACSQCTLRLFYSPGSVSHHRDGAGLIFVSVPRDSVENCAIEARACCL